MFEYENEVCDQNVTGVKNRHALHDKRKHTFQVISGEWTSQQKCGKGEGNIDIPQVSYNRSSWGGLHPGQLTHV